MIISCFFFFFFKQKTAYEMRISDWSSDVCSSDLFDLLFKGYSDARYRQNYQIDADELEILLRRVHRLHDIAERLCHRRLRAYSRQEAEGHLLPGKITGGSGRL